MNKQRVIIVPIDGSKNAINAVKYAAEQAKAFQDKIILLNVFPKLSYNNFNEYLDEQKYIMAQEKHAKQIFSEAGKILDEHQVPHETKIRTGVPSIEISEEAKERNARAIIMGTRGMGPAVSNALGSVSYSLVHLAPCPITLVPLPAEN